MAQPARQPSRRWELHDAMMAADLTPSDFRVFMTLLGMADSASPAAEIPVRFQPRSVAKLAARSHVSVAGAKRSLNHLQRHGWLERYRHLTDKGIGGRGHPTRYKLCRGRDCDCSKAAQPEPDSADKAAQADPIKGLTAIDVSAGQPAVCAEGVREEEELEEGEQEAEVIAWLPKGEVVYPASWKNWPAGSIGEQENTRS